MGKNTGIQWTHHTFNPWWGCTRVSPGCDNCYAADLDKRFGGNHWDGSPPRRTSTHNWNEPRRWNREAARTGIRPRVFVASMADVFDNNVPQTWRDDLWKLIRETPFLNWMILTKRIGNAKKMLPIGWPEEFPHVGLMITVVNQEEVDRDIPKLILTPAKWRGLSCEPLLSAINIAPYIASPDGGMTIKCGCGWKETEHNVYGATIERQHCIDCGKKAERHPAIDWVIVGGESGGNARPMHPVWVRSIRDQCLEAGGVPFFFKQWGEWQPYLMGHAYMDKFKESRVLMPDNNAAGAGGWPVYNVGKKAAGRLLDDKEWNEFPKKQG